MYDNVYLRGDKMIGKTLQNLLDEKGINVNELSKMINVSNQTLYSIIKRDNMKIDFEVLLKICKALNVSVEYFYSDYTNTMQTQFLLDEQEKELITAYRNKPEMQSAVNTLLGISNNSQKTVEYPMAARTNAKKIKLSAQEVESLKKAKEYNEDI